MKMLFINTHENVDCWEDFSLKELWYKTHFILVWWIQMATWNTYNDINDRKIAVWDQDFR